ncbi:hypothetical protein M0804_012178 [Polistes exclamans]|nr:hypothetical protein M0804_012178 [Polistes exclamans]
MKYSQYNKTMKYLRILEEFHIIDGITYSTSSSLTTSFALIQRCYRYSNNSEKEKTRRSPSLTTSRSTRSVSDSYTTSFLSTTQHARIPW